MSRDLIPESEPDEPAEQQGSSLFLRDYKVPTFQPIVVAPLKVEPRSTEDKK